MKDVPLSTDTLITLPTQAQLCTVSCQSCYIFSWATASYSPWHKAELPWRHGGWLCVSSAHLKYHRGILTFQKYTSWFVLTFINITVLCTWLTATWGKFFGFDSLAFLLWWSLPSISLSYLHIRWVSFLFSCVLCFCALLCCLLKVDKQTDAGQFWGKWWQGSVNRGLLVLAVSKIGKILSFHYRSIS